MILKYISIFLIFVCGPAFADVRTYKKEDLKSTDVTTAKIVFHAEVQPREIMELVAALDEINVTYPAVKTISLYINSGGGRMDSGYMAYEAIKNSGIPVDTVGIGFVGSAATMMFCAGKNRLSTPLTAYMVHPVGISNDDTGYIRPNQIDQMQKVSRSYSRVFRKVYKDCLQMRNEELESVLYSEDHIKYFSTDEVITMKMATGRAAGIRATDVSYFIDTKPEE